MHRSWNFQKTDGDLGLVLKSVDGADFKGLRLGTTATPVSYGAGEVYSIVARRPLQRVWKLDYTSQTDLDNDCLKVIEAVGNLAYAASVVDDSVPTEIPITPEVMRTLGRCLPKADVLPVTYQITNMNFVRLTHFNEETGAETSVEEVAS